MTKLYTIKPLEWEQTGSDYHSKNSYMPMYINKSLIDLETYTVWLGTALISKHMTLDKAKQLAEERHQKLIEQFLNPVTE